MTSPSKEQRLVGIATYSRLLIRNGAVCVRAVEHVSLVKVFEFLKWRHILNQSEMDSFDSFAVWFHSARN